ncbi:lysophospholipid acyltransferase family protein [Nocardioides donggukensis]|uniref:1-acyl-sn-glycerol-3-phosphate acyltransferase n=1 Tax=Nocardioides donggukensis TaxID=2774019 RepID=A0A927K309_9ACTN|nr:lysophospholipid acyltransferase family protein [Nocardioides donggukensis]MBD8869002.1 1-acyl-sn-glycerol-3-phosphate acyltransferase [Nocardioides donggukensis]
MRRRLDRPRGWAFTLGVAIVKPLMLATTRRTWLGGENIPATGGCVLVVNHVSHADPLTTAHLVYDHGRLPRYLAKSGLFDNGLLAYFLRSAGQIPVKRLSTEAGSAYDAAVAAVRAGECVVVYPEGTITRDPDLWPMTGRTGAARIALTTGCPVIPVAHWGVQDLLPPYGRPRPFPRKRVTYRVGPPLALDDLLADGPTPAATRAATDRIMAAITGLLEELRGGSAPARRFDPRSSGVREIGNPNRRRTTQHRTRHKKGRRGE